MADETIDRIADFFERNKEPSTEQVQTAIRQIAEREGSIRRRLNEITEQRTANAHTLSMATMDRLDEEERRLSFELTQIPGRVRKLLDMETQAKRREAPALAARLMKELSGKLDAAEKAKAAWLTAREELNQTFGNLGEQRGFASDAGVKTKTLSADLFSRVVAVLEMLEHYREKSWADVFWRSKVQRVGALRHRFLDETPEEAFAETLKPLGLKVGNLGYVINEYDSEHHVE